MSFVIPPPDFDREGFYTMLSMVGYTHWQIYAEELKHYAQKEEIRLEFNPDWPSVVAPGSPLDRDKYIHYQN